MDGDFAYALGTIAELLTPHALQYLEPLWGGVHEKLQKLQISLLNIQRFVEDAEARQLTDQAVRCWLLRLKDAVYDAEDILDEAKTHALLIKRKAEFCGRPRSKVREFLSNPLMFEVQLGNKLRNVNERINELIEEMRKFNLMVVENNSKPLGNRPQTYSYVHESRVILGRDEDKEKLVQMLIRDSFDENVAVVSIVGMGGLGKTTLAQLVYGDDRVKDQFNLCIWVCVSDDFDAAKLAGKIMHTASGKICDHTNMEVLQKNLREVLGEKRYLLVLDDVWNEDFQKWDALRKMLLVGGEGSRILVTTRNEKCSRMMGAQKPYILSLLSEESSWVLFEQKAFATGAPKPPKLVEIGKKIVEKCQGLPLAIEVLGGILHYKREESEWQAVLENETWKLQHTDNKIIPELWLSYVDLPTHLKKCFAFCAIFPKNYDFEEEELIQYWMAHGFVPSQNGNDIEVEGREIFTELIRRSLFQCRHSSLVSTNGRVCKMHDLIHDLAHFVMGTECFTSMKSSVPSKIPVRPRHLNLSGDENYDQGDCSIIHSVLRCPRDYSLLSKLKLVRVLDLSEADIDELPASIEHLHHLRYLDISYSYIRKLPESICMLVNLQTLKLNGCDKLSELPKSITYMNSLRHLQFDHCSPFKTFPAGLSRLQNLKTLTGYTVADDGENNIGELKSLALFGKLALYDLQKVKNADDARKANLGNKQNIHTLKLSWGDDDDKCCSIENAEEVLEALKSHDKLKNLEVSHYPGRQFPVWMRERQQFQYLHQISLRGCRECEQLPPLEILPSLESLSMSEMDGIKYIVNNSGGNALQSFPALKKLTLSGMSNLEGWCVEEGGEANLPLFPCLIRMDIRRCPKLTTMPPKILPCLKYLTIGYMDVIKHIINNISGNALQSFPALKELILFGMENLERWRVEEGSEANLSSFPSVIQMYIRSCPKLTTVPIPTLQSLHTEKSFCETQNSSMSKERRFFKHLESLRSLTIDINHCSQLSLPLVFQNLTSLRDLWVWSLENLVSWPDEMQGLQSLKDLTIASCKNFTGVSSQGACGPPLLKRLRVFDCDALRELPMCLKSLQFLSIYGCPSMKSLWPEMGHLTSLSSLWLYNCPNLASLSDGMQGLTSLQDLCIIGCPALKTFPRGLQRLLPTLKQLRIEGCPELERLCKPGGDYYNLLSTIPIKQIGGQPEETIQVPHEINSGGTQALKFIATNRFLLSAIFICAIAYFIYFLFNKLNSQNEQEVWYILPT
ncbi:putative virus X resistance protein-like, coiled-coil [Dioscorea sansibarensis]